MAFQYSGILWENWYEIITSTTKFIPPGGGMSFHMNDVSYGGMPPAYRQGSWALASPQGNYYTFFLRAPNVAEVSGPFNWRIKWQVPVANSGQLGLQYFTSASSTPILINESIVGTSYGHCQLVGDYIFSIPTNTISYFISLVNPAANNSNINLMSHGDGNLDAVASIIFEYLF